MDNAWKMKYRPRKSSRGCNSLRFVRRLLVLVMCVLAFVLIRSHLHRPAVRPVPKPVTLNDYPLSDEERRLLEVNGIHLDVDQSKKAQARAQQQADEFKLMEERRRLQEMAYARALEKYSKAAINVQVQRRRENAGPRLPGQEIEDSLANSDAKEMKFEEPPVPEQPLGMPSFQSILELEQKLLTPEYTLPPGKIHQTDAKVRANAFILVLCRESDLTEIKSSIRNFEDRFNRRYNYPYIFFSETNFSTDFQDMIQYETNAKVQFEIIEQEHWSLPERIDRDKFKKCLELMTEQHIIYGGLLSYRLMCRWFSGLFYKHKAVAPYDWYWRLEPGVQFFCDINYDPFIYMQRENKLYGFTIALHEIMETVPSLWKTVADFAESRNITEMPLMKYFANYIGDYSGCHFWSNFEIASLDLWRSDDYNDFFNFLDERDGFFYERWGDAPVHSLYVGLRLKKEQVHFFNDIGYRHESVSHCLDNDDLKYTCICPKKEDVYTLNPDSCIPSWLNYNSSQWRFGLDVNQF